MTKKYEFNYGFHAAYATFLVDRNVFTEEHAKATLEFFTWSYDKTEDKIDAVLKKYALRAIEIASSYGYNEIGVIDEFNTLEGYCRIDGSSGITLTHISAYEFEESELLVQVTDFKPQNN